MFLRYVMAKEQQFEDEMYYRSYVSEALYAMLENQANNRRLTMLNHFMDYYKGVPEEQSAEEIVNDLISRGALEVVQ